MFSGLMRGISGRLPAALRPAEPAPTVDAAAKQCDAVANDIDVRYMGAQRALQQAQQALQQAATTGNRRDMLRLTNDIQQHKATLARIDKLRRGARRNAANTRDAKLVVGAAKAVKLSVEAQRGVMKEELGDMSIDDLMDESAALDDDMNEFADAMGGSHLEMFEYEEADDGGSADDERRIEAALAEAARLGGGGGGSSSSGVANVHTAQTTDEIIDWPEIPSAPMPVAAAVATSSGGGGGGNNLSQRVAKLKL